MKTLTFPRIVILLSLIGSGVLGYIDFTLARKLDRLRSQNQTEAPELVRTVQQKAHLLKQLQDQLEDDKWSGQNNPGSYVRTIAQHEKVKLGQVDVTPGSPRDLGNGIVDQRYTIKPVTNDRGWSKQQVGNFLYQLEAGSPRVRVTTVKMFPPAKKRYKPEDFPEDEWSYEVEITSRQRQE